jgi:hypothetical protein
VIFHVHERLRDTTGPAFQISKKSGRRTTSWDGPNAARATVSPSFHTLTGERLQNSRTLSSWESGIAIDFQLIHIHTSWYANYSRKEAEGP